MKTLKDLDIIYFNHDINAWSDSKLLEAINKYGPAAYGIWWIVIEALYENRGTITKKTLPSLCKKLSAELEMVEDVVYNYQLFTIEDDIYIKSRRVTKELENRLFQSNRGSKGAEKTNSRKGEK